MTVIWLQRKATWQGWRKSPVLEIKKVQDIVLLNSILPFVAKM